MTKTYYTNIGKQILHIDDSDMVPVETHIADAADVEKAHFLVAAANAHGTSGFERVTNFHEAFELPVNGPGYVPTIDERLLRGKLMLEEVLEHLQDGLGLTLTWQDADMNEPYILDKREIGLIHIDNLPYDPVATLDGLCDVKVIANGTGVAFGLPVPAADTMIYESNMSKLGPDGKPIINGVTPGYEADYGYGGGMGYRPDLPIGKVLKPATFVAPDIASLLK